MEVGQKAIKPTRVNRPWAEIHEAKRLEFSIDEDTLTVLNETQEVSKTKTPTLHFWRWIGTDDQHAYLVSSLQRASKVTDPVVDPPTIWKFQLFSGRPVARFPVFANKEADLLSTLVIDARIFMGRVVLLTSSFRRDGSATENGQMFRYTVVCIDAKSAKHLWEKSFESAGERPKPGAYLWSPRRPDYAQSDVQGLSLLDEHLIVCAGSLQDILCLDAQKGEIIWKCERIWEFQRGFIGPSVWQHFVGREGKYDIDSSDTLDPKAVEQFNKNWNCAIIGGPVIVTV